MYVCCWLYWFRMKIELIHRQRNINYWVLPNLRKTITVVNQVIVMWPAGSQVIDMWWIKARNNQRKSHMDRKLMVHVWTTRLPSCERKSNSRCWNRWFVIIRKCWRQWWNKYSTAIPNFTRYSVYINLILLRLSGHQKCLSLSPCTCHPAISGGW